MEFCPECESLLRVHNIDGKTVLKCRCGYIKEIDKQENVANATEEMRKSEINEKTEIEIIDDNLKTAPTKIEECPKCGNKKASFWQVQTRSGDEGMTTFFRCTKCRFTWREY